MYLTVPVIGASSGMIGSPLSSKAGDMLKADTHMAMAMYRDASASRRPGHNLIIALDEKVKL